MNVIPKDVSRGAFDLAAWRQELLALKPVGVGAHYRRGQCGVFAAARQKATLARYAEGKEAWNAWASAMLERKSALEGASQWYAQNEAVLAFVPVAAFSTEGLKHRFGTDVSFTRFVFAAATAASRAASRSPPPMQ